MVVTSEAPVSFLAKLSSQVFPRMTDFYALIQNQCDVSIKSAILLEKYVQSPSTSLHDQINKLTIESEAIRQRNLEVLKNAFATPLDREDIYRACTTVDYMVSYASNIVSGMEEMGVSPDKHIVDMVTQLRISVETMGTAYKQIVDSHAEAGKNAKLVIKTRKSVEKIFRSSLASLFNEDEFLKGLQNVTEGAKAEAVLHIMNTFKRREIYRQLNDAAIDIGKSGKVLYDIIIQSH
ncbi:MAG: hypothetical protein H7832_05225 [Magnetococcus sp. DMHC-6]